MTSQRFQLVIRAGPNPGKVFELTQPVTTVGRDISNDITINDAEVSRKHAQVTLQSGGYVLEDLGSTNGTYAAGQRLLGPHVLRPGELIKFGENISLSFEAVYDENATLVSTPPVKPDYAAPAPPRQPQPTPVRPAPQPAYSGRIPQSPAQPYYPEAEPAPKKTTQTLLIAGCGVLLVLSCLVLAGGFIFDALNLYCTPPFDYLFYCP